LCGRTQRTDDRLSDTNHRLDRTRCEDSKDPLKFLTDFRDEILAVVRQVRIAGALDTDRVRSVAIQTVDELFSLMKPPSTDD
jgi:hypothetical protein